MSERLQNLLIALGFLAVFAAVTLSVTSRQMVPTGDEPHYLMTAHSLVVDGDIELRENYINREYRIFYPGLLAKRTTANYDKTRELPAFGLGPALFLAPFYWIGLTWLPANLVPFLRLIVCSITAIAIYHLLVLGRRRCSLAGVLLVIAAAALSSPIVIYSSQFYPEILAFLLIVLALRVFDRLEAYPRSAACGLALLSTALLWLHPKYLMLALLIFFYGVYCLRRAKTGEGVRAVHILLTLAGLLSFFLFLHAEYGSWSPNRIYGGWQKQTSLVELIRQEGLKRFWVMLRMTFGFWIDQRFGLIPYALFYATFFPALIISIRREADPLKAPVLLLFVAHYLALSWGAPLGGFAPPSRHFIVLIPLVLILMLSLYRHWAAWQKILFAVLATTGWFVAAVILTHYRLVFTDTTWRNPDGFSRFWESFRLAEWIPSLTATELNPGLIAIWIAAVILLSMLLYPRQKNAHSPQS